MSKSPMPIAAANRRYRVQVILLMLCYAAVLCIPLKLIPMVSNRWLKVLIALAPVIPVAFVLVAVMRLLSRVDELARRVHLEAAAMAAGVTAMLGVTCGFLENVGMPRLSGFWTYAVIVGLWGVFAFFLNRRYR